MSLVVSPSAAQSPQGISNEDLGWKIVAPGYLLPSFPRGTAERAKQMSDETLLLGLSSPEHFVGCHFVLCLKHGVSPGVHPAIAVGSQVRAILGPLEIGVDRVMAGQFAEETILLAESQKQMRRCASYWIAEGGFWNEAARADLKMRSPKRRFRFDLLESLRVVSHRDQPGQPERWSEIKLDLEAPKEYYVSDFGAVELSFKESVRKSVLGLTAEQLDQRLRTLSDVGFANAHVLLASHYFPKIVCFRAGIQTINGLTVARQIAGIAFPKIQEQRQSLTAYWIAVYSLRSGETE